MTIYMYIYILAVFVFNKSHIIGYFENISSQWDNNRDSKKANDLVEKKRSVEEDKPYQA